MGMVYKSAFGATIFGLVVSVYLESQKWGGGSPELPRATAAAISPVLKTAKRIVNEIPDIANREIKHDQDLLILGGVAVAMLGVWIIFRTWRYFGDMLGGPEIEVVAIEEAKTLTGSVSVNTERPDDLVRILARNGAKVKILAQHPEIPAKIDIKGVAPRLALLEVLKDKPELITAIDAETVKIENQAKIKANLFYGIRS